MGNLRMIDIELQAQIGRADISDHFFGEIEIAQEEPRIVALVERLQHQHATHSRGLLRRPGQVIHETGFHGAAVGA
jgi:hypothetical protein